MKNKLLSLILALSLAACSAFQAPNTVPVMEKYDATQLALEQVLDWAREHRGETQTILELSSALNAKDYITALEDARKLMVEAASAGDQPPREVIALVTLVEQALAADMSK